MAKRVRSSTLAGIFAILILMMNVFPIIAAAEGLSPGDMSPGNMSPGNMQPGDMKPGDMQPGDLEWDSSQFQPGQMEPGNMQPGEWQAPNYQPEDLNPDDMQPGDLQPGDMKPGDVNPGEMEPGQIEQGDMQPGDLQPGEVNPSGSDGPGMYDVGKLTFKEITGGTLTYSAGLIEAGNVDLNTALRGKTLFLTGLGFKGLDVLFEDTHYVGGFTGLGVDVFDAISSYDNYQFIMKSTAITQGTGFFQHLPFSNGAGNIQLPGIVKGLNVAGAVISLPFDLYDTWDNFNTAFDSGKSSDEQKEGMLDGIGSLGSVLMDGGVIAAVIPGGQTVAVVLFAAGAVLWIGSRVVKYADKIKSGVEKAFGWLKSIFA